MALYLIIAVSCEQQKQPDVDTRVIVVQMQVTLIEMYNTRGESCIVQYRLEIDYYLTI